MKSRLFPFYLFLFCLSNISLQAQSDIRLQTCSHCLNEEFEQIFQNDAYTKNRNYEDTLKFKLTFSTSKQEPSLLYVGDVQYMQVVSGKDTIFGGRYQPISKLENRYGRFLLPLITQEGNNQLNVRIWQNNKEKLSISPKLFKGATSDDAQLLFLSKNEKARWINALTILLVGVIFGFSTYQYLISKIDIFRIYGIYMLSILTFLLCFSDDYLQLHLLFPQHPEYYIYLNIVLQGAIYAFYAEFGLQLLDIKKGELVWSLCRVFQVTTISLTLFHSVYLFIMAGDQSFIIDVFYKLYFIPLAISTTMAILIIRNYQTTVKWFLIAGSGVITVGVIAELVSIFVNGIENPRDFYFTHSSGFMHFSYVEVSYVLESLIFLMGINYRNNQKEKESVKLKENIILQLKEKERLEKEVNELLKQKLESSERKLQLEQALNENERNTTLLMQSQLTSLQLQMNPHYLFNSLNSINDFIITKQPEEASEYLALYAKMMRNTLKTSDETFNTLTNELENCQDYLALEKLRFDSKFSFEIRYPIEKNLLNKKIPTMLVQPILENAVWHGIMPYERKGKIVLDASESSQDEIHLMIYDTGDGFDPELQEASNESYGLRNIQEKINLFKKIYGINITIEMKRVSKPEGFCVSLLIPSFE